MNYFWELFVMLFQPLAVAFAFYQVVEKNPAFVNKNFPQKFTASLALGASCLVIILSLWAMLFNQGFAFVSRLLILLYILSLLLNLPLIIGNVRVFFVHIFASINNNSRATLSFIFLFLAIFLAFFFLRPVTDSDIIEHYLPLARSIIRSDSLPLKNFYDDKYFIIPPSGAPVLFASFYTVSGNILNESFRLVNLPFFIGMIFITYEILKLYLPVKLRLSGILVLLLIPMIEDYSYSASLYPDFIFTFFSVFCFLKLEQIRKSAKTLNYFDAVLLGLSLAAALLIKFQAIFLFAIVISVLLLLSVKGLWRYLFILSSFIPYMLVYFTKAQPYVMPYFVISLCFMLVSIFASWKLLAGSPVNSGRISPGSLILLIVLSSLGFTFTLRNYLVFGSLNDMSQAGNYAGKIQIKIGISKPYLDPLGIFSIISLSELALFFLIPKLLGFVALVKNKSTVLALFILTVWYSWWVLFLGADDPRWLLPVLPYLVILIIFGLQYLFSKLEDVKKAVILAIPFFLISSKFIFWHLGLLIFGENYFRTAVAGIEKNITKSWMHNPVGIIMPFINRAVYVFTARSSIVITDLVYILIMAVAYLIFVKIVLNHGIYSILKKFLMLISVILYLGIIILTAKGNPAAFAENEKDLIFSYWGQAKYAVPYFKKNLSPDDKILIVSLPTGLSYFVNTPVYNLEYGGDTSILYPIRENTDPDKALAFFSGKHIRYLMVRSIGGSENRYLKLKELIPSLKIFENKRYATEVLSPGDSFFWHVYKLD